MYNAMSLSENKVSLNSIPKPFLYACVFLLSLAGFMIWDQIYWWNNRDDYSFGFLVPLFALYVLFERKSEIMGYLMRYHGKHVEELKNSDRNFLTQAINVFFIGLFISGVLLFFLGALIRIATTPQNPASLAIAAGFSLILLSTAFIFSEETLEGSQLSIRERFSFMMLFLFPALIWLVSAPLVSVFETKVRVFLLTQVTIVIFNFMDFLGFAIERQGNVLVLPKGVVGVEEACSGIRSLTACIFAGSFLAAVYLKQLWKKVLLVLMAMVFAVITNLFRSAFLTLWAYFYGSEAINDHWVLPLIGDIGSVHDVMGFAVLGLTSVGLILLLPIMNFSLSAYLNDSDTTKSEDNER